MHARELFSLGRKNNIDAWVTHIENSSIFEKWDLERKKSPSLLFLTVVISDYFTGLPPHVKCNIDPISYFIIEICKPTTFWPYSGVYLHEKQYYYDSKFKDAHLYLSC
jgi:hypothetical protein